MDRLYFRKVSDHVNQIVIYKGYDLTPFVGFVCEGSHTIFATSGEAEEAWQSIQKVKHEQP